MASIDWPASLPLPVIDGYGFQVTGRGVIWSRDRTYRKARLRQGKRPYAFSVKWIFSGDEMRDFVEFFRVTLLDGKLRFNIDLVSGDGQEPHDVTFTQSRYNYTVTGGPKYEVTAALFCPSPPALLPETELEKYLHVWQPLGVFENTVFLTDPENPFFVRT